MKTAEMYRHCPVCSENGCGEDMLFEQPHLADCPDTPDGECPEWACTQCGTALVVATAPVAAIAHQPVRAA